MTIIWATNRLLFDNVIISSLCFSFSAPRHLVGNLPPYTNVSLKMILTNPEGRKESDETIIQTDEDGKKKNIYWLLKCPFQNAVVYVNFRFCLFYNRKINSILWCLSFCLPVYVSFWSQLPSLQSRNLLLLLLAFTDCVSLFVSTVPGPVPTQSLRATPSEETISLYWKEPAEPNGVITQYEVVSFVGVVDRAKLVKHIST